ncbi:PQQ-binding-like beta-propeller repeat protein [Streptomyces sp. BH097]|uniref:outer membrane protein assembly factor BamB family protein n=1 Tax=unclassified Streptomyces TaxID=2593676 RepID=UPI003BB7D7F5
MAGHAPLEPGDPEQIGPYRMLGRLGAGGMGRVYLGRSPGGRNVAVKVVREELSDDAAFRQRFTREVAAARRVTGYFTAAVVDAAPDADPPWLATAYVPGPSLRDAVADHGAWPEGPVLALGAALAEALESIRAQGLEHRDLKPANVLLADDGPRIIDFGISRAVDDTRLTLTDAAVGTPGYMPPEVLLGRPTGPAGDVFALGAVLVYAATGKGPFSGGNAHFTNYRVVHEPPDLAGAPDHVARLAARCLDKDPDRRPTAAQLVQELEESAAARQGGHIIPGWLPEAVTAEISRGQNTSFANRGFGALSIKPDPDGTPPPGDDGTDRSPTLSRTSLATKALASAQKPDKRPRRAVRRATLIGLASTVALTLLITLSVVLLNRGDDGADADTGKQSTPGRMSLDEEWTYDGSVIDSPVVADGKVYVTDRGGALRAVDAKSGQQVWSYKGLDDARFPGTLGGALYVSDLDSGTLHSVNPDTGTKRWAFEARRKDSGDPGSFSPVAWAGDTIYVASYYLESNTVLHALDARTGRERWHRAFGSGLSKALTIADGVLYVGASERYQPYLYALSADTGKQRWRIKAGKPHGNIAFAVAHGDTVYFGLHYGDKVYAADTASGKVRWTVRSYLENPELSAPVVADGVVYVTASDKTYGDAKGAGAVYAFDAHSGKRKWEHTTDGPVSPPVLTDGALYLSEGGTLRAFDAGTGNPLGRASLSSGATAFTVSGDHVYFNSGDEKLHAARITLTRG